MELQSFVDWFQFTVKTEDIYTFCKDILGIKFKNFTDLERGMQGYKKSYVFNKILLLSDGNNGMGIHTIMSSSAISLYSNNNNFFRLLSRVLSADSNITRIDIAIDDYRGNIINLQKIKENISDSLVLSKWRNYTHIKKADLNNNSLKGETLYFGSRTSEIFMRIYRKDLEQKVDDKSKAGWTRLELELKKDKARSIAYAIHIQKNVKEQKYFTDEIHSILNNYIRFLKKGKGKNKSRWPTAPHWEKFLLNSRKIALDVDKKEQSLETVKKWVFQQVSVSLAMLIDSQGGDLSEIIDFAKIGKDNYKDKHIQMLLDYANRDSTIEPDGLHYNERTGKPC